MRLKIGMNRKNLEYCEEPDNDEGEYDEQKL